jgi:L-alanine-DL-glutamate epimerase-like enolase superfamily enzyme
MNDVANLDLHMAIPNTRFMAVLLPQDAWWHGLVKEIQIDAEGFAHDPQKPGLGYEIALKLVKRNQIAVLSQIS